MNYYKDFNIAPGGRVSALFVEKGIYTFSEAAQYIKSLPYKRNRDKRDITCVLTDNIGTCSTKHILLKRLAIENGQPDFRLMMGIYKMSKYNTPAIAPILSKFDLEYIPEAHIYLRYHALILDFTRRNSSPADFVNDLLEEKEILPMQALNFKISHHKNYISAWQKRENIPYSAKELWNIRENCIEALANNVLV